MTDFEFEISFLSCSLSLAQNMKYEIIKKKKKKEKCNISDLVIKMYGKSDFTWSESRSLLIYHSHIDLVRFGHLKYKSQNTNSIVLLLSKFIRIPNDLARRIEYKNIVFDLINYLA